MCPEDDNGNATARTLARPAHKEWVVRLVRRVAVFVALGALPVAGCGQGGETTVTEKTVIERPADECPLNPGGDCTPYSP